MAIDFKPTNTFGANKTERTSTSEKVKAQYWLNFGYVAEHAIEGEDKPRFISLPMGIPLDITDKKQIRGRNAIHNNFVAAQNDLLDQLLQAASALKPGDDYIIEAEQGFAVQVRRVDSNIEAPATDETNPFARPNMFNIEA